MTRELFYLDTYVLQQDMRIRMPKTLIANMPVEKGKTQFDIFIDKANGEVVLKIKNPTTDGAAHD